MGLEYLANEGIKEALRTYEPLNSFIVDTYSKELSYIEGLNLERYEDENDYADVPLVGIDPIGERVGDEEEENEYHLALVLVVQHEKSLFDSYTQKEGDTVRHRGVFEILKFYRLVKEALKASSELKCYKLKTIEFEAKPIDSVSNHIEHWGYIKLTFADDNKDFCIGGCS